MHHTLQHGEFAWKDSRRTGKSQRAVDLAVFKAILGRKIEMRWASEDQIIDPRSKFRLNPFVKRVRKEFIDCYYGSYPIHICSLTEKKSHSTWCDDLFLDEEKDMDGELVNEAMIMTRNSQNPFILHSSSPAIGTPFETNYKRLEQSGQVETHTYQEVMGKWLNKAAIEQDRLTLPPWFFQQEYLAQFTVPGGALFKVIETGDILTNPTHCGVDINPTFGHVVVTSRFSGGKIFVCGEEVVNVDRLTALNKYQHLKMEIESGGGINDPAIREIQKSCPALTFSKYQFNEPQKDTRVMQYTQYEIVVNPKQCPNTFKSVREAAQNEQYSRIKLKKTNDAHYTDSLLHNNHQSNLNMKPVWIGQEAQQTWANLYAE
jgi:hypothetical protein